MPSFIDKNFQVTTWLRSLETGRVEEPTVQEPAAKRLCRREYRQEDTFANAYNLLGTPPPTAAMSNASTGQKRGANELDSPIDSRKPVLKPNVQLRPLHSPRKSQRPPSPTKPKSKDALLLLEKPVIQKGEASFENLPQDVKGLFSNLWTARQKLYIIPHEVEKKINKAETLPCYFRTTPTPGAENLHSSLCAIQAEARAASLHEYHEAGWNHLVHTPLLKLVYPSIKESGPIPAQAQATEQAAEEATEAAEQAQPKIQANARLVPTMTATIWGEYISTPVLDISPPRVANSETGLSSRTSVSQRAYSASEYATTEQAFSATDLYTEGYTRSDGKKVDYVIAIDPFNDTALQRVISFFTREEAIARSLDLHFNQTLYRPLKESPIACSIETKVDFQSVNPLLQLGTWIAAWHKRMYQLRKYILSKYPSLSNEACSLPSTLLLEVINHKWNLYFACDQGNCIDLYGPLEIGATMYITEVYTLVASLQAIRAWAETTFANGIGQWLMYDKLEF
ncbi:hypothetical protein F4859DRAFT_518487 [Xylaria cf. heliscus]|nr:hypothetical protein F4859DRAFT_518487 [Xylaria cf. heliscus]